MSFTFSCGFSRVAVKQSFHKPGSATKETDPVQRWKNYQEMLDVSAQSIVAVDKAVYVKRSRTIYDLFRKMNSRSRNEYIKYFSTANWKSLPVSQRQEHTMSNCRACEVHHFAMQSLFPSNNKLKPQKLVQEAFVQTGNKGSSKAKPTQKAIKSAVQHIYSKINGPFQKIFKVNFAEAQTKVSELGLQQKKSKLQQKSKRRQRAREEKQNVQKEWSKRDTDTMLATRQSYSQRARERSTLYFETIEDATVRVGKRKRQEDLGLRKKKRHSPPAHMIDFDKENLLKEVTDMKDGDKVSHERPRIVLGKEKKRGGGSLLCQKSAPYHYYFINVFFSFPNIH